MDQRVTGVAQRARALQPWRHPVNHKMVEHPPLGQSEPPLAGMSEVLHRVEGLERQILELERQIVSRLDHTDPSPG